MSKEGFFRRWSRRKAHGEEQPAGVADSPAEPAFVYGARAGEGAVHAGFAHTGGDSPAIELPPLVQTAPHPAVAPPPGPARPARKLPTLDDVASLGPDSDFSAFVSEGVDKTVQRLAMKKLFSDPHFNVLDGLDVYIDDYNKPDLIPAAMLASLQHAKSMFARFRDDDKQDGKGEPGAPPNDPPGPDEQPPQGDT
jgi:hypothetical protein